MSLISFVIMYHTADGWAIQCLRALDRQILAANWYLDIAQGLLSTAICTRLPGMATHDPFLCVRMSPYGDASVLRCHTHMYTSDCRHCVTNQQECDSLAVVFRATLGVITAANNAPDLKSGAMPHDYVCTYIRVTFACNTSMVIHSAL